MGAKGEALARQFEAKAQEAGAYIEKLSDADLKRVTEAEKWTVAATAHHLFGAYDRVPDIAKGLVAGQSPANFSTKVLDQMNAQHAKDFAACGKADVMALHHGVRQGRLRDPRAKRRAARQERSDLPGRPSVHGGTA